MQMLAPVALECFLPRCKKGTQCLLAMVPRTPERALRLDELPSEDVAAFMARAVSHVEGALGLHSYHLRVVPYADGVGGRPKDRSQLEEALRCEEAARVLAAARSCGFLVYVVGDNSRAKEVPIPDLDLDGEIRYKDANRLIAVPGVRVRDTLLREPGSDLTHTALDFQGRPCYVVTIAPSPTSPGVIRRHAGLGPLQVLALWREAHSLAARHGGFEDMRLNAGTFQNVGHLHLKVFFQRDRFVAHWAGDKVYEALRHALNDRRAPPLPTGPATEQT